MNKAWSTVATFNVLYILNLWIISRSEIVVIKVFNLAQNSGSVPIFGLTLGSIVTLISLWLLMPLIMVSTEPKGIERVPMIWIDSAENDEFRIKWKCFSLFVTVIFPLIAQIYFWVQHNNLQAWTNHAVSKGIMVSLYEYVPPVHLLNWDDFRYGSYSRRLEEGWAGVSYIPFWQPLIMAVLSGFCLWMALRVFKRIFRG